MGILICGLQLLSLSVFHCLSLALSITIIVCAIQTVNALLSFSFEAVE